MKLSHVEPGYCRVYFKQNRTLYCFQEGTHGQFSLYICSRDGEPSHTVDDLLETNFTLAGQLVTQLGVTRIEERLREFLNQQRNIHANNTTSLWRTRTYQLPLPEEGQ
jgi:hypothetical protein